MPLTGKSDNKIKQAMNGSTDQRKEPVRVILFGRNEEMRMSGWPWACMAMGRDCLAFALAAGCVKCMRGSCRAASPRRSHPTQLFQEDRTNICVHSHHSAGPRRTSKRARMRSEITSGLAGNEKTMDWGPAKVAVG